IGASFPPLASGLILSQLSAPPVPASLFEQFCSNPTSSVDVFDCIEADNICLISFNPSGMDGLQLSADARALFQEGISMVLSRWSSLQLAIENEWGGRNSREKALKLASDIFIWFTQTKGELYIDDLENLLDEAMLSLNTEVADGSIEEVSYEMMSMHEECLGGNYDTIQRLRASTSQARPVQHVRQMESDDEEDDDNDGDMMVDAPETKTNQIPTQAAINQPYPSNAAPAEDGWVVVSSKKNKELIGRSYGQGKNGLQNGLDSVKD
ncbi:hypothetical protein V2J09_001116, partial [Rumex salicifolius]